MQNSKEKANLLDTIPMRCKHITTEWNGENIVLAFPRFKHEWMRRFLLSKGMSPDIHLTLEEHGSAVWQLIDGQRTVQELISLLTERFPNEEDYPARITTYIMQLQKEGFLELKVEN